MYVKKILIERLIDDVKFRNRLADRLNLTERAVFNTAKRYLDEPKINCQFTKMAVIQFFKEEGYAEDSILTDDISAI